MIILGLTGSIGMGKSTVADMFRSLGVPVYDADAAVHRLYGPGGAAVAVIGEAFPGAVRDGAVDRAALSHQVVGNEAAMKRLESLIHPLVARDRAAFLEKAEKEGAQIVLLDVPLLFETGGEKNCDKVAVVSAPGDVQRARVLAREGMDVEKFDAILARQVSDAEKRARADFVIDTNTTLEETLRQVREIVTILEAAA